jgi:hypothetical protein
MCKIHEIYNASINFPDLFQCHVHCSASVQSFMKIHYNLPMLKFHSYILLLYSLMNTLIKYPIYWKTILLAFKMFNAPELFLIEQLTTTLHEHSIVDNNLNNKINIIE